MIVILPAAIEVPLLLSWSLRVALAGYLIGLVLLLLVPIDGAVIASQTRAAPRTRWNRVWVYALSAAAIFLGLAAERTWLPTYLPLRRFNIPTGAMAPTLLVGDVIVADMRDSIVRSVGLGELVVFEAPDDREKLWVKRLAGLPGDTVEVRNGLLVLNGEPRSEGLTVEGDFMETLGSHTYQVRLTSRGYHENYGPEKVPPGSLFLLGDNRWESRDSRSYGFIPFTLIRGRVRGIHWSQQEPWQRTGARFPSG